MFGESESESPRVPSPWDSLISTPVSSSPAAKPLVSSSPPTTTLVPKLVPEADDGNVEYKLQLLSPSPARFARLVTQLKWRLLEGGGQAYYELGVADSGALVGLARAQLEQSLETLEMMAGEIGASVIVVKEIEVPAALAELALAQDDPRRVRKKDEFPLGFDGSSTENETTTDEDDDSGSSSPVFTMDPESDVADSEPENSYQVAMELEIFSVFKPRPFRAKASTHIFDQNGSRGSKYKKHPVSNQTEPKHGKQSRRVVRERKKEEKRKALELLASGVTNQPTEDEDTVSRQATLTAPVVETDALLSGLETLHVSLEEPVAVSIITDDAIPAMDLTDEPEDDGDENLLAYRTPSIPHATFPKSSDESIPESSISVPDSDGQTRLIVEALVVRKMSLQEAFLDFGGFSLI
ncbi:hypothetical protein C8J56DRAFT_917726 [Mycena floridula]|nr:hypothetical protein C8J56DRAFT_917726 [Mycena floridula]